MIKELIKIANRLDTMGFKREADAVDGIIRKIAGGGMDNLGPTAYLKTLDWIDGVNLKELRYLVDDYMSYYERSRDWDNPDHEDDAIMADEEAGKIAQFIRNNIKRTGTEEEHDDKVYSIMETLIDKLKSDLNL